MSVGPKEDVYDEKISPLVSTIIELCKEHSISTFIHFELDDYLDEDDCDQRCMCTTSLPLGPSDDPGDRRLGKMVACARTAPTFLAMTVSKATVDTST